MKTKYIYIFTFLIIILIIAISLYFDSRKKNEMPVLDYSQKINIDLNKINQNDE
ncbi:MAG: hypothetical protein ACD_49C00034G0009 [uncultured bacterium (gcode 4)]|uniref:Uncharacterized protein n=1 Tax=uncultured bacterium (gcode 4) TaxID=1234023 RepID=K2AXR6_9BACT|nr:MAG: hypothetical protein ACD_49C00034G0009 [uncultured bacterium (gcode 4)]MCK9272006.1 hypothetical protein [Candidatus Gracilibacteria bacterium]